MSQQLGRALNALEVLADKGPLTIEAASELTRIPRSTLFKLFKDLESIGYVSREKRDGQTDHWFVTLRLVRVSSMILARLDLREQSRAALIGLSRETNEIAQLGVLHGDRVLYVDVVRQPQSLIAYARVGTELDINLSAAGKILVANLAEPEIDALLARATFHANTERSITDPQALKAELKKIRQDGYAFDDQAYAIGVRCVAAPVFDYSGQVVGAINVTGHISTMGDDRIRYLADRVMGAAREASRRMGGEAAVTIAPTIAPTIDGVGAESSRTAVPSTGPERR